MDAWFKLVCEPEDENAMLNLYYTSGTTGNPKGVMLSHRNIYANALTTIISFKLDDATVWHHIAPLFHRGYPYIGKRNNVGMAAMRNNYHFG